MQITVLYHDPDITVVSKPSGVVVNRAATVKEETIQDWFAEWLPQQKISQTNWKEIVPVDFASEYGSPEEIFAERGGVVHRLDKETSGVLLLANNPGALVELLRQFRTRETAKKYTCLVHGKFQIPADTIQIPLGRSTENRTKFAIDATGQSAETKYQVQKFYPQLHSEKVPALVRNLRKKIQRSYQGFSLVECWPKTGRTHQIRVHMAAIKHPIVSDETYLGKKRQSLDALWCPRLFLHASELEFKHPRTQEKIQFKSELSPELLSVLNNYLE